MRTKITALILLWVIVANVNIASGASFELKLDREYYNPFAVSQSWLLAYPDKISKNDCIRLSFSVYDNRKNKELSAWTTHLYPGRQKSRIFFFLTNALTDSPDMRLDVIQAENSSFACTFMNNQLSSVRLASSEKMDIVSDAKTLLLHICPAPDGMQFRRKDDIINYDFDFIQPNRSPKPVNFDFNIYLTLSVVASSAKAAPVSKHNIELEIKDMDKTKIKEYLLKRKAEIEKEASQGKASVPELNAVQKELNKIYLEEK